jgi:hypothetical protein
MGESKQDHHGWSRGFLSVRLTEQRTNALKSISFMAGQSLSPSEALDHALSLAIKSCPPSGARDANGSNHFEFDLANELEAHRREMASLAHEVRAWRSATAFRRGGEEGESSARPLREWLDAEARARGEAAFVAQAAWNIKTRGLDGTVALEMTISGLTVSNMSSKAIIRATANVFLEGVPATSPIATCPAIHGFYFACEHVDGGDWALTAHEAKANGEIGERIDIFTVR